MRSQSRRPLQGAVLAVALVTLAGCGEGGGSEPSGLAGESSSPPAQTTPAETPSPTPTPAGPTEHAFPDAGVTVVEPAAANEVEAAALATYVEFAREWRWTLREVRMSERLTQLTVGPVLDGVQNSLDYQLEHGIRYGGEMVITPVVEDSGDRVVVLGGCIDGSRVLLVDDGVERPPDGIDEFPVVPMRVTVANDGHGWRVNENTVFEGESC